VSIGAVGPERVRFDRSDRRYLSVHVRFGPNADLRLGATGRRRVEVGSTPVIQVSKLGSFQSCRYDLTDHEWAAIKPMLPSKPRGVARVNDRRVLNGTRVGLGAERALATELPTMSRSPSYTGLT